MGAPPTGDSMQSTSPNQPSVVFTRLLRLMPRIGIGLLVAFVILVLFVGLEMAISLIAPRFGAPPSGTGPNLIYWSLRGITYLILSGVIAWAIYRLIAPPRRRYWIALGIVAAILISPAGIVVQKVGFLLLIIVLRIPIGA